MAIWDKILGKKEVSSRPQPAAALPRAIVADAAQSPTETAVYEEKAAQRVDEKGGKGAGVLLAPHTTEKATDLAERGVYILRVAADANKRTVAEVMARRYGVVVERVRMIVQPAKERRRGRQIGWKQGFKKAVVRLKEGQRIETL